MSKVSDSLKSAADVKSPRKIGLIVVALLVAFVLLSNVFGGGDDSDPSSSLPEYTEIDYEAQAAALPAGSVAVALTSDDQLLEGATFSAYKVASNDLLPKETGEEQDSESAGNEAEIAEGEEADEPVELVETYTIEPGVIDILDQVKSSVANDIQGGSPESVALIKTRTEAAEVAGLMKDAGMEPAAVLTCDGALTELPGAGLYVFAFDNNDELVKEGYTTASVVINIEPREEAPDATLYAIENAYTLPGDIAAKYKVAHGRGILDMTIGDIPGVDERAGLTAIFQPEQYPGELTAAKEQIAEEERAAVLEAHPQGNFSLLPILLLLVIPAGIIIAGAAVPKMTGVKAPRKDKNDEPNIPKAAVDEENNKNPWERASAHKDDPDTAASAAVDVDAPAADNPLDESTKRGYTADDLFGNIDDGFFLPSGE